MRLTNSETIKMYSAGGFRERYAMEHGNRATVFVNGEKCLKWTYDTRREYQDANGATYNTARGVWVN